jgi:hypothetical protein
MTLCAISVDAVVPYLILAVIGSVTAGGLVAWNRARWRRYRSWQRVQATIEYGNIEYRMYRNRSYHFACLNYSYSFNGEPFSGYVETMCTSEEKAARFIEKMHHKTVFVRANPLQPKDSILLREDQPERWIVE